MDLVQIPSRLDLRAALAFAKLLRKLPDQSRYIFDFSQLKWVEPFGMLFVAQAIKDLRKNFPGSDFDCSNLNTRDATSYAAHVGFFTACGFSIGNHPGFRPYGGSTYIPLTFAEVRQIASKDHIESIAFELADQLTQGEAPKLNLALIYSFREIIRNVVEHSNSKTFAYCAQYYPTKGIAELTILDSGVGLKKSLSNNPYLPLSGDQDAIKFAVLPGISGKTYPGVRIRPNDVWQNSGYGLYMNYRLCNEGGSFFICSGSKGLLRSDGQDNLYYETDFDGTALRLKLNASNLYDVEALLKRFSDEGEIIARQVGMGAIPTASTMSKMLRNNFKIDYDVYVGDTVKHAKFGEGVVTEKSNTPQGEMLWVNFKGGRRKKVLVADIVVVNIDTHTYVGEETAEIEAIDESILTDDFNDTERNFHDFDF